MRQQSAERKVVHADRASAAQRSEHTAAAAANSNTTGTTTGTGTGTGTGIETTRLGQAGTADTTAGTSAHHARGALQPLRGRGAIGPLDRTGDAALEEEQTDQRRRLRVCEIRVRRRRRRMAEYSQTHNRRQNK